MTKQKRFFVSLLTCFILKPAQANTGSDLKIELLPGWSFAKINHGSFEEAFTGGALGALSYGRVANDDLLTVLWHKPVRGKAPKLSQNVGPWRNFLFPKAVHEKVRLLNERTFQLNGEWRYLLEYESQTGSGSNLDSAVLAMVIDGELHVLLFETHEPLYKIQVASVRELYKTVDLHR